MTGPGSLVFFKGRLPENGRIIFSGWGHRNHDVWLGKTQHLLIKFVWGLFQGRTFTVN